LRKRFAFVAGNGGLSRPHRRDRFLHQPGHATDVTGRTDAVAETRHDEAL
jgi:hypothetical protein